MTNRPTTDGSPDFAGLGAIPTMHESELTLVLETAPDDPAGHDQPDQPDRGPPDATESHEQTSLRQAARAQRRRRTIRPRTEVRGHVDILVHEESDYEILSVQWGELGEPHGVLQVFAGPLAAGRHSFPFALFVRGMPQRTASSNNYALEIVAQLAASAVGAGASDTIKFRLGAPKDATEAANPKVESRPVELDEDDRSPWLLVRWALAAIVAPCAFAILVRNPFFDGLRLHILVCIALWVSYAIYKLVQKIKAFVSARAITTFEGHVEQISPHTLRFDLRIAADCPVVGADVDLVREDISSGVDEDSGYVNHQTIYEAGYRVVEGREFFEQYELELPNFDRLGWSYRSDTDQVNWRIRVIVKLDGRSVCAHRFPLWIAPEHTVPAAKVDDTIAAPVKSSHPTLVHALAGSGHLPKVLCVWVFGVFYLGFVAGGNYVKDEHCKTMEEPGACFEEAMAAADALPFRAPGYWVFGLGYGGPLCLAFFALSRGAGLRVNLRSIRFGGR